MQNIFEILVIADGVHDSFVLATVPLTYMRWAVRQIPALHHYVDPCARYATVKFYTAIMITLCPEVLPHSPSILGSMFTLVSLNAVRGERVLVISGGGRVFRRRETHATTERAGYTSLIYGVHNAMDVVGCGPAN